MSTRTSGVLSILLASAGACAQTTLAGSGTGTAATTSRVESIASTLPGTTQAATFDRADRRARTLIEQLQCARRVARLRRQGVFGPIDSLGALGQCPVVDGQQVGVFFAADTLFSAVSRISAVDIATSTRRPAPIDTAAILAVGRATRTAQLRGMDAYLRAERQYSPIAFRFDDRIEVWLIPLAVLTGSPPTVGGERGYVFSADGRRVVHEVDRFDSLRSFAVPDTGIVRIPSSEDEVPTMTELVLANLFHASGRRIAIEMARISAMLVGEGDSALWVHVARGR